MKKLFFCLALLLVSSFAFASNGINVTAKENVTIQTTINKIDYNAFVEKVKSGEIIVAKVEKAELFSFTFYDSCGGVWEVSGSVGSQLGR